MSAHIYARANNWKGFNSPDQILERIAILPKMLQSPNLSGSEIVAGRIGNHSIAAKTDMSNIHSIRQANTGQHLLKCYSS
jgi:hypothetical protein